MLLEKVRFTTDDGLKLFGILHYPKDNTDEITIFIHGIHSNCFRKRDDILAEELCKNNIAYFTFNNRGAETVTKINGKLYGAAYENPNECIFDINSAIEKMLELGYKKIHLLGHSLGSSKLLYWYNTSHKYEIKSIGLLSLIDMNNVAKAMFGTAFTGIAEKIQSEKHESMITQEYFRNINILPLSVGTFLKLFIESDFNCISYNEKKPDLSIVNKIKEPLFIRFGTANEYLVQSTESTVSLIKQEIKKTNADISFIDGADHSYHGKEKKLAEEYIHFLQNK